MAQKLASTARTGRDNQRETSLKYSLQTHYLQPFEASTLQ